MHTVTVDGQDLYHGLRQETYDVNLPHREQQLRVRENELLTLIDEVCFAKSREILQEQLEFPEWLQLDNEKVVTAGHSFGGMTAIRVA
jgi:predicted dienelactone hydrolase